MLYLRKMKNNDSENILNWRNNPAVSKYMYTSHAISEVEHEKWMVKSLVDRSKIYWIIEMDGEDFGLVNIYDINLEHKKCSWAYYIGSSAARGKGVGTGVEYAILDFVFNDMKFNKLWCEVLLSNERVWKLHQHFGFTREALYRQHISRDDRFLDVVGLGILEVDWRNLEPELRERLKKKGLGVPEVEH